MHCFLMGQKSIDHKDGNGLNNQRSNLRPATAPQNGANQGKHRNNKSGFKGVSRWRLKWKAELEFNRKRKFAVLNFPDRRRKDE